MTQTLEGTTMAMQPHLVGHGCSCQPSIVQSSMQLYEMGLYEKVHTIYSQSRGASNEVEKVREYLDNFPWQCLRPEIVEVLTRSASMSRKIFEEIFMDIKKTIPPADRKRACYCDNNQIANKIVGWKINLGLD